jgi:hypothetical protein
LRFKKKENGDKIKQLSKKEFEKSKKKTPSPYGKSRVYVESASQFK